MSDFTGRTPSDFTGRTPSDFTGRTEASGLSTRSTRTKSNSTLHYSPFITSGLDEQSVDNLDLNGAVPNHRLLGWVAVSALVYFNVSGGPFGSEGIISAAGPAIGLSALVIYPLLFALPVALVTAELTTAFPEDGGYTIWVSQSFGTFWGFQEGYWSWISGVVDNATYPAFAMDYFNQLLNQDDTDEEDDYSLNAYAAKAGIVTVLTLLNVAGLRCVDRMLIGITVFSLLPFLVFIAFSAGHLDFSTCLRVRTPITLHVCYKLFKMLFWNFNGFDGVSTFAGEVQDPKKSYTRGLGFALIFMSLTYLIPLTVATALNPAENPWDTWGDAAFPLIFQSTPGVGSWLAYWLFAGAMLAQFGQFMTELLIDSYQLHGMALQGLVPAVFASRLPAKRVGGVLLFDTPGVAIFASWVIMMGLVTRDFDEILDVDNVLTCLALILELIAAVHLRFTMPDLERPFKVPGGKWRFLLLTSMPFALSVLLVIITLIEDYKNEATALYSIVVLLAVGACAPYATHLARTRGWCTFLEWHPDCWHEDAARVDTSPALKPSDPQGAPEGSVLGALLCEKQALREPLNPVVADQPDEGGVE